MPHLIKGRLKKRVKLGPPKRSNLGPPNLDLVIKSIFNCFIQIFTPRIMKQLNWIIIHSASADVSADLSADMPENRLIKLKIILKHSRML